MFRFFETLVDPFQPYVATTPPASVWRFIAQNIKPLRHVIAASLVFTIIGALIELWLVYYAGRLVDVLTETPRAELWGRLGPELLAAAAVLLLLRPATAFIRESLDDVAFRPNATVLIRWRAHRHLLGQSVGWFRNEQSGRLGSRMREIGITATGAAYQIIHTLSYVGVYILGSFWLMAAIDVRLLIPLGTWALLYVFHMAYAVPRFRDCSENMQTALSNLASLFVDTYANIDIIKLFADPKAEDAESRKRFQANRQTFLAVQRLEVIINVGMVALSNLLLVGLVGYAVYLWQQDAAPLGLVAAALALSVRISSMADWMLDSVSTLFGWVGSTRDALQSIAQPLEIKDLPNAPALLLKGAAIGFDGVSHHYGRGGGGLDRISFDIAAGEKVGLVGPSGAGKSTLVNLLLRFFEAEAGTIAIDGQDISVVSQESLRRHISMVAQDASLLNRSVADNIAYGRGRTLRPEIEVAAKKAEADGFIANLRDVDGREGYDAVVGERGVRLSGGQRQRIALARAILKDAPILILDEATSALDSEVEATILDSLYRLMEGKTVIAIAHRLSTIARMDRIVVLDKGRVAEVGTHKALLAANGIYARLWVRQSGGFIGISPE